MAKPISLLFFLLALTFVAESFPGNGGMHRGLINFSSGVQRGGAFGLSRNCNGLIGECINENEELMMESDISRRNLAQAHGKYISYGALSRDRVPCNRRGHSYYNCQRSGRANPYKRGCSVITKCARMLR